MLNESWRIELLGGLRVRCAGCEVVRFRTEKTGALLGYLAYHSRRAHPREALAATFWPDSERGAALQSLRTALSSLRHQLQPAGGIPVSLLVADRAHVGLNLAAAATDVSEFHAALDAARRDGSNLDSVRWLTAAAHLYDGPLLAGYRDEWILPEREALQELMLGALRRLATLLEHGGDPSLAAEYVRRALAIDPLDEEAYCILMRLCIALGQPAAAVQQFRRLERVLQREVAASPGNPARELVRQARALLRRAAAPGAGLAPFAAAEAPADDMRACTLTLLLAGAAPAGSGAPAAGAPVNLAGIDQDAMRALAQQNQAWRIRLSRDYLAAVFGRASDALACAVAWREAARRPASPNAGAPVTLRMALHAGESARAGAYYAPLVRKALPLLTAAHGGQILLTESAAILARGGLAPLRLADLGLYRLSDPAHPERIFQVCPEDADEAALPATKLPPAGTGGA